MNNNTEITLNNDDFKKSTGMQEHEYFTTGQVSAAPMAVQGQSIGLTTEQRAVIEEAAQVLESAAAHNRSKGRTVLERTQQDRADRLRAVLVAAPAAQVQAQPDDLPLSMSVFGTREAVEAERLRRTAAEAQPVAGDEHNLNDAQRKTIACMDSWTKLEENKLPAYSEIYALAHGYNDMLRGICFEYAAGGYNSDGFMQPSIANDKVRWIIEDVWRAANRPASPAAATELSTKLRALYKALQSPHNVFDSRHLLLAADEIDRLASLAASVAQPAPGDGDTTTREQYRNMFMATCSDLGAINEALGLDPDDGGADPILEAISALKAQLAEAVDTAYHNAASYEAGHLDGMAVAQPVAEPVAIIREAIEAAFEERAGWRVKIAAAVRALAAPTAPAVQPMTLDTEAKALIANLAAVVRVQNGNRHADINSLLDHADRVLSAPAPTGKEG